jgi:hypothetical protein
LDDVSWSSEGPDRFDAEAARAGCVFSPPSARSLLLAHGLSRNAAFRRERIAPAFSASCSKGWRTT